MNSFIIKKKIKKLTVPIKRVNRQHLQLKHDEHIKLDYYTSAYRTALRALAADTWTDIHNQFFSKSFERGINGKRMHLLLDRWWGIWFDWCRRQTQQRSEPCGNRSWEAYAIPSDWCGLRCQKRPGIKQISRCSTIAHSVLWLITKQNLIEMQFWSYIAHQSLEAWFEPVFYKVFIKCLFCSCYRITTTGESRECCS